MKKIEVENYVEPEEEKKQKNGEYENCVTRSKLFVYTIKVTLVIIM